MRNGSPLDPPHDRDPLPTCVKGLARLPEEYEATVRAGLGFAVGGRDPDPDRPDACLSDAQLGAISDHVRLLLAWNEAINLSGIRVPDAIAREHVLDSLTALPVLRRAGIEDFVDLGSGGGFPGIPLAVALPARRVLLIESIAKKARFLTVAVDMLAMGDRVAVESGRAETAAANPIHRGSWGAVVARAVADLGELAELSLPLLRTGGLLVAWKRRPVDDELARSEGALRILGGRLAALEAVSVPGLEDHVLAVVEKAADTPPGYPRDPAARRRRPL